MPEKVEGDVQKKLAGQHTWNDDLEDSKTKKQHNPTTPTLFKGLKKEKDKEKDIWARSAAVRG
jgi:hypothetical protein